MAITIDELIASTGTENATIDRSTIVEVPTAQQADYIVPDNATLVELGFDPSLIGETVRNGDDLILVTTAGEVITLVGYFDAFEGIAALAFAPVASTALLSSLATAAGLAGGAVAVASGGGDSDDSPGQPTISNVVGTQAGTLSVSGTGEAGAEMIVTFPNGEEVSVTVGEDGTFEVTSTTIQPEGEVRATQLAQNGDEQTAEPATADYTDEAAPSAASISNVSGNENGTVSVEGTGEVGATVTVTFPSGEEIEVTVGENGTYEATSTGVEEEGEVTASQVDVNGVAQTAEPATADYTDEAAPSAASISEVSGNENGTVTVEGTGEVGATVTVTFPSGEEIEVTVGENGTYEATSTGVEEEGEVTASQVDVNGVAQTAEPATADYTDEAAPSAASISEVSGNENGTVTVEGTGEVGATVTVTFPSGEEIEVTVGENGTYEATSTGVEEEGEVTASQVDVNGVAQTAEPVTADYTDEAAPSAASISEVSGNENGTVTVEGTGEVGATVTVTFPSGEEIEVTVGENGTYEATSTGVEEEGEVTASQVDVNGVAQTAEPATADYTDEAAPSAASISEVSGNENGTVTVEGTGEVGATVTVTFPSGEEIEVTVGENGTYEATSTGVEEEGEVTASQVDVNGVAQTAEPATADYTDEAAPSAASISEVSGNENGTVTVEGTSEVGATVTVTFPSGEEIEVTVGENGTYEATSTGVEEEGEVTASQVDVNGVAQTDEPDTDNYVDEAAPSAPTINSEVSDDGKVVTGEGEPGATLELFGPTGAPIGNATVDANGEWSVTVSEPITDGEELSATQTDGAGNTSPEGNGTIERDNDGDGVRDNVDIDDDDDGILDTVENGGPITLDLSALQGSFFEFGPGLSLEVTETQAVGVTQPLADIDLGDRTVSLEATYQRDLTQNLTGTPESSANQGGDSVGNLNLQGFVTDVVDPDNPNPEPNAELGDHVEFNLGEPLVVQFTHETNDVSNFDPVVNGDGDEIRLEAAGGFSVHDPDGQLEIVSNADGVLVFRETGNTDLPAGEATWAITTNEPVSTFGVRGDSDATNGLTAINIAVIDDDFDNDGIIDSLDTDSDNGGIGDNIEAQYNQTYVEPLLDDDGNAVDVDGDGLNDAYDENLDGAEDSIGLVPADTDGDGTPDVYQGEADADTPPISVNPLVTGLETTISGIGVPGSTITFVDGDNNSIDLIDEAGNPLSPSEVTVDENGEWTAIPATPLDEGAEVTATQTLPEDHPLEGEVTTATVTTALDTDADGVANTVDIDDDNDGILDVIEEKSLSTLSATALEQGDSSLGQSGRNVPGGDYEVVSNIVEGNTLTIVAESPAYVDTGTANPITQTGHGIVNRVLIQPDIAEGESISSFSLNVSMGRADDGYYLEINDQTVLEFNASDYRNDSDFGTGGQFDTTPDGVWKIWLGEGDPELTYDAETGEVELLVTNTSGDRVNALDFMDPNLITYNPLPLTAADIAAGVTVGTSWSDLNGNGPLPTVQTVTASITVDPIDSDGDGIVDRLDTDSDNGGISDTVEAQFDQTFIDVERDEDGNIVEFLDEDGDGLHDAYDEDTTEDSTAETSIGLAPADTNDDGVADFVDDQDAPEGDEVLPVTIDALIFDANAPITGTGVVGATITLKDQDGATIGTAEVQSDGTWSIQPEDPIAQDAELTAELSDAEHLPDETSTVTQTIDYDTDGDNVGNLVDIDDDNDGILDVNEGPTFDTSVSGFWFDSSDAIETSFTPGDLVDTVDGNITPAGPSGATFNTDDGEADIFYTLVLEEGQVADTFELYGQVGGSDDESVRDYDLEISDTNGNVIFTGGATSLARLGSNSLDVTGFSLGEGAYSVKVTVRSPYLQVEGSTRTDGELAEVRFTDGGSPLTFSGATAPVFSEDTDGDGLIDSLDTDSDNAGISDNAEAQYNQAYIAPALDDDGNPVDVDGDGLNDAYDENLDGAEDSVGLVPADADGDGTADFLDAQDVENVGQSFVYSGAEETFIVPDNVFSIDVSAWGAGGADGGGAITSGGAGGFVGATLAVNPGDEITIIVGEGGLKDDTTTQFGGGGAGGSAPDQHVGSSGGGRSAILINGEEVLTAGGGGGGAGGIHQQTSLAGAGGQVGQDATASQSEALAGGGATATEAGEGGTATSGAAVSSGQDGTQFEGGAGGSSANGNAGRNAGAGGGGGGGYFGGGGGAGQNAANSASNQDVAGGGGSSFADEDVASNIQFIDGDRTVAPNTDDPLYTNGVAVGGDGGANGGNGLVVISFTDPETLPLTMDPFFDDGAIIGTGVVGATITLRDADDNLIGETTVEEDGTFSFTPEEGDDPVAPGTEITVTQSDAAHVPGATSTVTQTVDFDTDGDGVGNLVDIDDDNDGILDIAEFSNVLGGESFSNSNWDNTRFDIADGIATWTSDHDGPTSVDGSLSRTVSGLESLKTVTVDGTDYVEVSYDFRPELTVGDLNLNITLRLGSDLIHQIAVRGETANPLFDGPVEATNDFTYGTGVLLSEDSDTIFDNNEFGTIKLLVPADDFVASTMDLTFQVTNHTPTAGPRQNFSITNLEIITLDTDEDGIIDSLDTDSDNGGAADYIEAQHGETLIDVPRDEDGNIFDFVDADGDGLHDAYDADDDDASTAASVGLAPADADNNDTPDYLETANGSDTDLDGDGVFDHIDTDNDNDGILDAADGDFIPLDFSDIADETVPTFSVGGTTVTVTADLKENVSNRVDGDANGNLLLGDELGTTTPDATTGDQLELTFSAPTRIRINDEDGAGNFNAAHGANMSGLSRGDEVRLEAVGGFTVNDPSGQIEVVSNVGDVIIYRPVVQSGGEFDTTASGQIHGQEFEIFSNQPVSVLNVQADGDTLSPIKVSVFGDADTDNDGIVNYLDVDSDGDGIWDQFEEQVILGEYGAPNFTGSNTSNPHLFYDHNSAAFPGTLEGNNAADDIASGSAVTFGAGLEAVEDGNATRVSTTHLGSETAQEAFDNGAFIQMSFTTKDDASRALALSEFVTFNPTYVGNVAIMLDGEFVADVELDAAVGGFSSFAFDEIVELSNDATHTVTVVPYNYQGTEDTVVFDSYNFNLVRADYEVTEDTDNDGNLNRVEVDSNDDGVTDREEVELDATDLADLESGAANSDGYLILADEAGLTLDFNNVTNVTDLEYINIDGTTGQTLTLSDLDVLSSTPDGSIIIFGDTEDTVEIADFTETGETRSVDGQILNQYEFNGAEAWIDEEVTVVI